MGESFLKSPSWGNLADAANKEMQNTIDGFWRRASWDNPALATWDTLNNSLEMWEMRVRAQWVAVGCTDEMIRMEAMRLMKEAMQG